MDAQELRQFSVDDLRSRVRQWQDELFRSRFKAQTSEARDTSVLGKLRKDIARGNTVISEKLKSGQTGGHVAAAAVDDKATAKPKAKKAAKVKGETANG